MNLRNWQWKYVAVAATAIAVSALAGAGVVEAASSPSSLPACSQTDDGTNRTVVCPDPPTPTVTVSVPGPTTTVTVTASPGGPTTTPPTTPPPTSNPPTTPTTIPPPVTGFPSAATTGPSAGAMVNVPAQAKSGAGWTWNSGGWIEVRTAGAVLDHLNISGHIENYASNVVISNDVITENSGGSNWGVGLRGGSNVTIKNNMIGATSATTTRLMAGIKDFGGSAGLKVIANNIYHTGTGIQVEQGLLQDNFVHDMGFLSGDHINGQTSNGGTTALLDIEHNTIENQFDQTDAVSLFEDSGQQTNRIINNNFLAGGGYVVYGGQNAGGVTATNIRITNNQISTMFFPNGGHWGPFAAIGTSTGDVLSGNTWADGPNAGKTVG